jgi:aubergine-like protein
LTVIVVNKRINQRFFMDSNGSLMNPPSGSVIDKDVVEDESNDEFDFYLIPQSTSQGCVLPTHFFVMLNESPLKKPIIEKFTYDLCHYYFNWTGPVKVPAPCMYAHKIAEYYNNIGKGYSDA